jgi:hypothetical protein
MTTLQTVNPDHITRRQKASPLGAGICVGLVGLFAAVPIGIRQKDWKVPVFSAGAAFAAAYFIALVTYSESTQEISRGAAKAAGNIAGGLAAYVLVRKNKKESE